MPLSSMLSPAGQSPRDQAEMSISSLFSPLSAHTSCACKTPKPGLAGKQHGIKLHLKSRLQCRPHLERQPRLPVACFIQDMVEQDLHRLRLCIAALCCCDRRLWI